MKKNNSYIVNLVNILKSDTELVGTKAIQMKNLREKGVAFPSSFVLTSVAFDDFLRSANLVNSISILLNDVERFVASSADSISEEIADLIMNATMPRIIEQPLLETYRSISPLLEDSFVDIDVSNIIEDEYLVKNNFIRMDNIKGEELVIESVKKAWCSIFSSKSLQMRANEFYNGPLSIAVLFSKSRNGEISGDFRMISEDRGETRAVLGFPNYKESEKCDYYIFNLKDLVVEETLVNKQDEMLVRTGTVKKGKKDIFSNIEIADEWRDKQKVNNKLLYKLIKNLKTVSKELKGPFEVQWEIVGGDIIFNNFEISSKFFEKTEIITKVANEKKKKNRDESMIYKLPEDSGKDSVLNEDRDYSIDNVETYLDISPMTSSKVHSVKYFDKVYFSSTKTILDLNIFERNIEYIKFIDQLYIEFLTVARASKDRDLLFSFSNLKESQVKNKIEYFGDERFIDRPEDLVGEYIALRKVCDIVQWRELNIVLPALRSNSNLKDLVRILNTYSEFHTIKNNIFVEISVPSFLFELLKIDIDVKGFVVDYFEILISIMKRDHIRVVDHSIMFDILNEIKKVCDYKKIKLIIKLDEPKEGIIDQFNEFDSYGIIFKNVPSEKIFEKLEQAGKTKLNFDL